MPNALVKTNTPKTDRNLWRTPPELFAAADRRYGPFTLDAAADFNNHLCELWLGPGSQLGEDALAVPWSSRINEGRRAWCNPPYSENEKFVAKAEHEAIVSGVQTTLLLPATTDVFWWHQYVWYGNGPRSGVLVEFLQGRVNFLRPDGTRPKQGPNFGSVLVTFLPRTVSEMLRATKRTPNRRVAFAEGAKHGE